MYHVLNCQWQEFWDDGSYLIWQKLVSGVSNPSGSFIFSVSKSISINFALNVDNFACWYNKFANCALKIHQGLLTEVD